MNKAIGFLRRSSPTILTCLSVAGAIGTTILAVKATPKALRRIEERKADCKVDELSSGETIRVTWDCYIPAAVAGLATITCIVGINCMSRRNQASLASAYGLINESYRQYRKAANSVYGNDADTKIKAAMAKETYISADGYSVYDADLDKNSEKVLCYDLLSERYFYSTTAAVLNAQYHINRNLQLRGYVSINEYYEFLGLDGIEHGDSMGWDIGELMESGFMWLDFDNQKMHMDDERECFVVSALEWPCPMELQVLL